MNIDIILDYLYQYNKREIFYKKYYEAKINPRDNQVFLNSLDKNMLIAKRIILPDIAESMPKSDFWTDDNLFSDYSNVKLMKHDRYTPTFLHHHDFFEMNYVLSGKCTQYIQSQEVVLNTGDIFFIALHTNHSIEVNDDSIILNILIRRNTFDDIFLHTLRNKSILSTFFLNSLYDNYQTSYILFRTMGDYRIRNQVLSMYLEQMEDDEYSDNTLVHMVSIFFNQLLRFHGKTAYISNMEKKGFQEQMNIISYLQSNFQTATLKGTAEYFNYTAPYCSRLIKQLTGNSFVQILREIRLQHAEALLRTTNMSVENLAIHLGYENSETLIRVFKRSRNMTPGQYRKIYQ